MNNLRITLLKVQKLKHHAHSIYIKEQTKLNKTSYKSRKNEIQRTYRGKMSPVVTEMVKLSSKYKNILNNPKILTYNPFRRLMSVKQYGKDLFFLANSYYASWQDTDGDNALKDANLYSNEPLGWTLPNGYHYDCHSVLCDINYMYNGLHRAFSLKSN